MAMTYRKINTKNLLPTSAKAASAKLDSPKYSKMNGKHERPGANDGNKSFSVRPFEVFGLIPSSLIRNGVRIKMTKLKANASKGKTNMVELISTPINATKIVDGRAIVSMIFLSPFTCSLLENFFLRSTPISINDKNVSVLAIAGSISNYPLFANYLT